MKSRLSILLLVVALLFLAHPAITSAQFINAPVVRAVMFYSPSCGHCHYVIGEILPPLFEQYGDQLQIIGIDVSQPGGQQIYQATIAHFQIPDTRRGVPTLIVGDVVLVGSGEIPEQLPTIIEEGLAVGGIDWPAIPGLAEALAAETNAEDATADPTVEATPTSEPTATPEPTPTATDLPSPTEESAQALAVASTAPVYLAYFYDPNCLECIRVNAELEALQTQYQHLVVQKYNVLEEAALNEAMCEKYGVPADQRLLAPMVFIGDEGLTPHEITTGRLLSLIREPAPAAHQPPWEGLAVDQTVVTASIVERFQQFSVLAVAGAGLLDGLNPCAFTTIIFFVSYLALVGRKGREILLVGAAFTLAVFLTYLLMGLGMAEVVRQIGSFMIIGRIIYAITALLCLVLAVVSLWDYIQIRRGRLTEIALQLPKALKKRIHSTIRTSSRMRGFVAAAFGAGVLVSIFELACTGQVYLPTIVFVTSVTEMRSLAIGYLVLYNLMFVTPLIIVFAVTYWGTSSHQLTDIFQKRAGMVKLFTAALFGVLGIWLSYMVYTTF